MTIPVPTTSNSSSLAADPLLSLLMAGLSNLGDSALDDRMDFVLLTLARPLQMHGAPV